VEEKEMVDLVVQEHLIKVLLVRVLMVVVAVALLKLVIPMVVDMEAMV
tara:strand:+ start:54 stop:197 length:144 start_codon:yes stop_codon:yes gene_type:complete